MLVRRAARPRPDPADPDVDVAPAAGMAAARAYAARGVETEVVAGTCVAEQDAESRLLRRLLSWWSSRRARSRVLPAVPAEG